MPLRIFRLVNLISQTGKSNSSWRDSDRSIHTFVNKGFVVELLTRWVQSISFEPRYSPLTTNQYAYNVKDFLLWLCEIERYRGLCLDDVLAAVNRRDSQEWILERKAIYLQSTTRRNGEIACEMFLEWLTTQEAGRVRTLKNTPYKTGKLISPALHR